MRLIDADALMADCQLAQEQACIHGREFANAFYSGGNEISTEWWCVEDMIENAPTIEPKRETGKWVEFDSDEERYDVIKCPYCKHTFTVDSYHWTDIGFVKDDFKFCPNCGADMRGEQDE